MSSAISLPPSIVGVRLVSGGCLLHCDDSNLHKRCCHFAGCYSTPYTATVSVFLSQIGWFERKEGGVYDTFVFLCPRKDKKVGCKKGPKLEGIK